MTRSSHRVVLTDWQSTAVGAAFLSLVPALAGLLLGPGVAAAVWLGSFLVLVRALRPRVVVTTDDGKTHPIDPRRSSLFPELAEAHEELYDPCRPTSIPTARD